MVLKNNQPSVVIMDYEAFVKAAEGKDEGPFGMFAGAKISEQDIDEVKRAWGGYV